MNKKTKTKTKKNLSADLTVPRVPVLRLATLAAALCCRTPYPHFSIPHSHHDSAMEVDSACLPQAGAAQEPLSEHLQQVSRGRQQSDTLSQRGAWLWTGATVQAHLKKSMQE